MKYKCCNCGNIFDEDEIKCISDYRGEFWGFPAYEDVEVSPCCNEDFEEYEEEEENED